MRKPFCFLFVLVTLPAMVLLAVFARPSGQRPLLVYAGEGETFVYLPALHSAEVQQVQGLQNGSFEEGWTDLPPAPGFLINQQPNAWTLTWVEPGQPIFDSSDLAGGVPECVHKLAYQLPPNEQPGGPDALILDGEATYKMFHSGAAFGAELRQVVAGLPPGSSWRLIVPIQLHLHNDLKDPYTAESGVWVNGVGDWANAEVMGDRAWYYHTLDLVAPDSGELDIVIRVKSKWPRPKDFFIDDVQLLPITAVRSDERGQ